MNEVDLIVRNADVEGRATDVAVAAGRVVALGNELHRELRAPEVIDAQRRALLPGLHDHHLHLLAMAGAALSVDLERVGATTPETFARAIHETVGSGPPTAVLRVVGYHESIAGPLDRWVLDALGAPQPLRVQHRSGAMWVLDSKSLDRLPAPLPPGAEHDALGRPTGCFLREDRWLREQLGTARAHDLGTAGRYLSSRGITGVTDMTPFEAAADLEVLAAARRSGAIPQHVVATGGPSLVGHPFPVELGIGPVKLIVDEFDLPDFDELVSRIAAAHCAGRSVAIHCIGRVVLALVIAAFEAAGPRPGDRLEHGSVVPPEFHRALLALGCTVVTQPGFLHTRGDEYLADVEADDLPHLWPCGSLTRAGIPVGCSSDAPYGPADPWQVIAAAVARTTRNGRVIGASERISAQHALSRLLSPLDDPGGPPRRITVGAPADLALLDRPLPDALRQPGEVTAAATWVDGARTHTA